MERRGTIRRLQGFVVSIKPTGKREFDEEGSEWHKRISTVELMGISKWSACEQLTCRTGRVKVEVVRWCCFDWHYRTGFRITRTPRRRKLLNTRLAIP